MNQLFLEVVIILLLSCILGWYVGKGTPISDECLIKKGAKNPFVNKPVKLPLEDKMAHEKCLKKVTWCDCIKDDIEELERLNNWEEEFEDELWIDSESGSVNGSNYKTIDITQCIKKYFDLYKEDYDKIKVKIKARRGQIVIERID